MKQTSTPAVAATSVLTPSTEQLLQTELLKTELTYLKKEVALERELMKKEVETQVLKKESELKTQQLDEFKKFVHEHPAVVNNINNIHNNNSQSYTQNNTLIASRQHIDSLVPITTRGLSDMVQASFKQALNSNKIIGNLNDLCNNWVTASLKDSIIVTDQSRGVAHWKDGDMNNKTVKDVRCNILSEKLQKAMTHEVLEEYYSFLIKQSEEHKTDLDRIVPLMNSQLLLACLKSQKKEMVKELGPGLIKYAKTLPHPTDAFGENKIKFGALVAQIERVYSMYVNEIVTSDAATIGQKLFGTLVNEQQDPQVLQFVPGGHGGMFKIMKSTEMSADHFLDFVKFCLVEAFGVPNKQMLLSVLSSRTPREDQATTERITLHFDKFVEWISFDRYKERTTDKQTQQTTDVCEYERTMISTLKI
jgi:hypothetical protein